MVTHGDDASHGAGRCSDSCVWLSQVQGSQRWDSNLTSTYWYLLAACLGFLTTCQVTATGPCQEGGGMGTGWGCADPVSPLAASVWLYQACGHCLVPSIPKLTEVRVKRCQALLSAPLEAALTSLVLAQHRQAGPPHSRLSPAKQGLLWISTHR